MRRYSAVWGGGAVPRAMLAMNGSDRHLLKIKGRYLIRSEKM
jgi:hypothetical protein